MIGCLMGLQPESADGTYQGGMQSAKAKLYKFKNRDLPFCDQRSPIFISTPQLTLLKVLAHCAPTKTFCGNKMIGVFDLLKICISHR